MQGPIGVQRPSIPRINSRGDSPARAKAAVTLAAVTPSTPRQEDSLLDDDDEVDIEAGDEIATSPSKPEVEALTSELIRSQNQNGRLDVENKYLLLRLRHQLKETETANAKAQQKALKLQEDITALMKTKKSLHHDLEVERRVSKEFQQKADQKTFQIEELDNAVRSLKWGFQSREQSLKQKLEEHKHALAQMGSCGVDTRNTLRELCESICEEVSALDDLILIEEEAQRNDYEQQQSLHAEVRALRNKLEELRAIHEDVCTEKQLLDKHSLQLEQDVDEMNTVLQQLKIAQQKEMDKVKSAYEAKLSELQREIGRLRERNEEVEVEREILLEGIAELEARLDQLQHQQQQLDRQYQGDDDDEPFALLEEAPTSMEAAAEADASGDSDRNDSSSDRATFEAEAEAKLQQLQQLFDGEKNEMLQQIDCLRDQTNQLQSENSLLSSQISAINRKTAMLEQQLKESSGAHQLQIEQIKAELEVEFEYKSNELRIQNERYQKQIEELTHSKSVESESIKKEYELLLSNRSREVDNVTAQMSALLQVMSKSQSESDSQLQQQIQQLNADKAQLQLQLETMRESSAELDRNKAEELEALREELAQSNRREYEAQEMVQSLSDKSRLSYEERIHALQSKVDVLEQLLAKEKESSEEQQTRLRVAAVIEKSQFEQQLADYFAVVNKLVQSRDRREQDVLNEKETLRLRYKRNEELIERDLEELKKRFASQQKEFEEEKERFVQRDNKREEELSRVREDLQQREKRVEAEYQRAIDELKSREFRREQELLAKAEQLTEDNASKVVEIARLQEQLQVNKSKWVGRMHAERQKFEIAMEQAKAEYDEREAEQRVSMALLRGDRVPEVEERISMQQMEIEGRTFVAAELTSTVLKLWNEQQQLEQANLELQRKLNESDKLIASLRGEIDEMGIALDTAEIILKESDEVKLHIQSIGQQKAQCDRKIEVLSQQLLGHQHGDYEFDEQLKEVQSELRGHLQRIKAESGSVEQQQQQLLQQQKMQQTATSTDAMLDRIRTRQVANEPHDAELSVQDGNSIETLPEIVETKSSAITVTTTASNAVTKVSVDAFLNAAASPKIALDPVSIFNSSVQFLLYHARSIAYLQAAVGPEVVLQSCGIGNGNGPLSASRSSSSKRLRAALTKSLFPDVQAFNIPEYDGRLRIDLSSESAEASMRAANDFNLRKANDKTIFPRRPVNSSVGKRPLVVASPGPGSPLSSKAHRLPRSPLYNSGHNFALSSQSKGDGSGSADASRGIDVADISFMVDMGDTYNALLDSLVSIEHETDTMIASKQQLNGVDLDQEQSQLHSGRQSDPLRDLARTIAQTNAKIDSTIARGNNLDKSMVGCVAPNTAGSGSLAGVDVVAVYARLENNVRYCTMGIVQMKDKLVHDLKESDKMLKAQYQQLQSLGQLVVKSRQQESKPNSLPAPVSALMPLSATSGSTKRMDPISVNSSTFAAAKENSPQSNGVSIVELLNLGKTPAASQPTPAPTPTPTPAQGPAQAQAHGPAAVHSAPPLSAAALRNASQPYSGHKPPDPKPRGERLVFG